MQYPKRKIIKAIVLDIAFVAFYLGIIGTAFAQITEATFGVHLRIVSRCTMTVNSYDGDTSVNCNRPVAYRINTVQQPSNSDGSDINRVTVNY